MTSIPFPPGQVNCLPQAGKECFQQGFLEGTLDSIVQSVPDIDACLKECSVDEDCVWWTFDSDLEVCVLMSDRLTVDTDCTSCVYGRRDCEEVDLPDNANLTRLFVVGGYEVVNGAAAGSLASAELVDLNSTTTTCNMPVDYPNVNRAAVATWIHDRVVVCGGFSEYRYRTINSTNP